MPAWVPLQACRGVPCLCGMWWEDASERNGASHEKQRAGGEGGGVGALCAVLSWSRLALYVAGLPSSLILWSGTEVGASGYEATFDLYFVPQTLRSLRRRSLLQTGGGGGSSNAFLNAIDSNPQGMAGLLQSQLDADGVNLPSTVSSTAAAVSSVFYDPQEGLVPIDRSNPQSSSQPTNWPTEAPYYYSYGYDYDSFDSAGDGSLGSADDGSLGSLGSDDYVEPVVVERTYTVETFVPVVSFKLSFSGLKLGELNGIPNAGYDFCQYFKSAPPPPPPPGSPWFPLCTSSSQHRLLLASFITRG